MGIFLLNAEELFEPTKCEACVITANDWSSALKRVHQRSTSEFLDVTETLCNNMNEYKIHKEKTGLSRFSKKQSKTIETLKELRDKGVQVKLDLPYELWDHPSSEITALRQECERILEEYEDEVETWFLKKHPDSLVDYLCRDRVLSEDVGCLNVVHDEF